MLCIAESLLNMAIPCSGLCGHLVQWKLMTSYGLMYRLAVCASGRECVIVTRADGISV